VTTGLQSLVTYAHITEFECGDDRSTVNYDALGTRLFDLGQPGGPSTTAHALGRSSPRVPQTQPIPTGQTASTGTNCARAFS